MTDEIEHLDFPTPDPDKPEPDPAVVARLDQEQKAYADNKLEFAKVYGFVHECRCAEDYAQGKLIDVTECFMGLAHQALQYSALATNEIRMLREYLNQMLKMNNDLASMLHEHGHDEELEKYFTESLEIEEVDSEEDLEELVLAEDQDSDDDDDDDNDKELVSA